jgi:hypothetical protein
MKRKLHMKQDFQRIKPDLKSLKENLKGLLKVTLILALSLTLVSCGSRSSSSSGEPNNPTPPTNDDGQNIGVIAPIKVSDSSQTNRRAFDPYETPTGFLSSTDLRLRTKITARESLFPVNNDPLKQEPYYGVEIGGGSTTLDRLQRIPYGKIKYRVSLINSQESIIYSEETPLMSIGESTIIDFSRYLPASGLRLRVEWVTDNGNCLRYPEYDDYYCPSWQWFIRNLPADVGFELSPQVYNFELEIETDETDRVR